MSHCDRQKRLTAAMTTVIAVGEAIRELGSVPSGEMYAQLMPKLSIEDYEGIIRILVNAKLVKRSHSHMLTWIGPHGGFGQNA